MKVVVVGLGKVGRNILQCLVEERHDIVAIDENAETVQDIVDRYDVKGLCGNGCIAENLEEAGADTADLLLSVTPSDEQNVLCCLIAKSLGAKNTIARVRDPEYNQQADFMREKLGIDRLVNPDKALAKEIIRLLRFPSAEKISSFADGKVEIVEMEAAQIAGVRDSVALAVINGNYALNAGLNAGTDALATEDPNSVSAQTYANVLVVKEGNEKTEKTQALVKALTSQEVKDYINNTYSGAVVPIF